MKEFDNSALKITHSSFKKAKHLFRTLSNTLKESKLDFRDVKIDEEDVFQSELGGAISSVLNMALGVIGSESVENAIMDCGRAVYDNEKVNEEFFEKEENRSLYIPIMVEMAVKNLNPFYKGLLSMFADLSLVTKFFQKLKSQLKEK